MIGWLAGELYLLGTILIDNENLIVILVLSMPIRFERYLLTVRRKCRIRIVKPVVSDRYLIDRKSVV